MAALAVLTALVARSAAATGEWVGFWVTEVGMIVPLTIGWSVLGGHAR
ncbi:MAG: hypothetical protein QOD06_401 [Candidatus Binatota bacterium]|nr:hypothetical protein [Candidatus Binatota bacterium]